MKNIPPAHELKISPMWNLMTFYKSEDWQAIASIYQLEKKAMVNDLFEIKLSDLVNMEYSKWAEIRTQYDNLLESMFDNIDAVVEFHSLDINEWMKRPIIELYDLFLLWQKNTHFWEL